MKKIVGWPVTWTLFWIGEITSRVLRVNFVDSLPEWAIDAIYKTYNRAMVWSADVQDWAGLDSPWGKVEPQ